MSDTDLPQHGPWVTGQEEIVPEQQLAPEPVVAAENRIAEADKEGNWRERYEHLARAHREQAQQHVVVEHKLIGAKQAVVEKNRQIRDLMAERRDHLEELDAKHDQDREVYDELFRQYISVGSLLSAIVGEEHDGQLLVNREDTREWYSSISERNGVFEVRAIAKHRVDQPRPDAEEDED